MKAVPPITIDDTVLLSSNVLENDYAAYNAGNSYALGDFVIVPALHKVYKSASNANVGKYPPSNPNDWEVQGMTNKYRMFDDSYNSQTSNADSIDVVMRIPGRADSIVLLNVIGQSFRVRITDDDYGLVYDKTYSLQRYDGILDYWNYCFDEIYLINDYLINDLPNYSNTTIQVTINSSSTAYLGKLVIGKTMQIGLTKAGMKLGIKSYSVKARDDFGRATLLKRDNSRYANLNLSVAKGLVTKVHSQLSKLDSVPVVYIGTEQHGSSFIYGFFTDFYLLVDYADYSLCAVEIEGLI